MYFAKMVGEAYLKTKPNAQYQISTAFEVFHTLLGQA